MEYLQKGKNQTSLFLYTICIYICIIPLFSSAGWQTSKSTSTVKQTCCTAYFVHCLHLATELTALSGANSASSAAPGKPVCLSTGRHWANAFVIRCQWRAVLILENCTKARLCPSWDAYTVGHISLKPAIRRDGIDVFIAIFSASASKLVGMIDFSCSVRLRECQHLCREIN